MCPAGAFLWAEDVFCLPVALCYVPLEIEVMLTRIMFSAKL